MKPVAIVLVSFVVFSATTASAGSERGPQWAQAAKAEAFAVATVVRWSKTKNKHGRGQPPWTKIEVTNIDLKRRPKTGRMVTVVPFTARVKPINLRIVDTKKGDRCTPNEPATWTVTLAPVQRRDFFDATPVSKQRASEYPFEAAVLYPAVPKARFLTPRQLGRLRVPGGFKLHTIRAAVDLTGNKRPDLLFLRYCCKAPGRKLGSCDYSCSRIYRYQRSKQRWRLYDRSQPC